MNKSIDVLIIVAHPDDESYLMSGTALFFHSKNKSTGIICATRGEKGGSKLKNFLTPQTLAKIRETELLAASKICKAKFVDFLNYKDGELWSADRKKLTSELINKINLYQPKIILTFGPEGVSGHKDHQTIGKLALIAASKSVARPKEIWLASRPSSQMKIWNEYMEKMRVHRKHFQTSRLKGVPDRLLRTINISNFGKAKLKAIYTHRSQGLPSWLRVGMKELEDKMLGFEYYQIIKLKA